MVGVLRELVSVLGERDIFKDVLSELEIALRLTADMVETANARYWSDAIGDDRDQVAPRDAQVNDAERRIRKLLAIKAVAGTEADAMHALRLMSVVKDVERLGDYAKNLAELTELAPGPLPDDEIVRKLRAVTSRNEELIARAITALIGDDSGAARALVAEGVSLVEDCEQVVRACAASQYAASQAVRVALAARFSRRIAAHVLNILSSLIMPLHELDFEEPASSSAP
jgi:phosphate uptake regulator